VSKIISIRESKKDPKIPKTVLFGGKRRRLKYVSEASYTFSSKVVDLQILYAYVTKKSIQYYACATFVENYENIAAVNVELAGTGKTVQEAVSNLEESVKRVCKVFEKLVY